MPFADRFLDIRRDPHSGELLARGGDSEAHSILQRAGFIAVVRVHETYHRAPTGLTGDDESRLATEAVARLRAIGYHVDCDADFDTDSRPARYLPLGSSVAHIAERIREATTTQEAAEALIELTAAHDGVLAALDEVLTATADFHDGLGQAADPAIARRLRHLQRGSPHRRTRAVLRVRLPAPAPHAPGTAAPGGRRTATLTPTSPKDTMHDHDTSERLASYADVLAGELPDHWSSSHLPPDAKDDLAELAELADRIWDLDLIAASLAEHPLQQAAILSRPDGAQLVLLDRHDERDGFLIAAIAPHALPDEAYRAVPEPNGIALADDPFLSAEQVTGDLLARYDSALAQVRHNALGGLQPSQPDRIVLTWQPDGSVATAPVDNRAGAILTAHGFAQDPQSGIYRLNGDDTQAQAHALQAIGPRLEAIGIGTGLQRPAGRTAPTSAPASVPPVAAGTRAPAVRGR